MSDDIIEYENLYNKIFYTIIKANFPRICKEILAPFIGGNEDVDETIVNTNFINSIKRNYQSIFRTTKTEIMFGIGEIDRQGSNGIHKLYSNFVTKLILDELIAYQTIKEITDEELVSFIRKLHTRIYAGDIPTKTVEDLRAEIAEKEEAAKEQQEEDEEDEKLNWKEEYEKRSSAYPGVSIDNKLFKTRLTTSNNERGVSRKAAAEDAYFKKISGDVISKGRARMRQTKSRLTTSKVIGGGLRRKKRKATRKLRKHYKSRKSTHKHIRRKK